MQEHNPYLSSGALHGGFARGLCMGASSFQKILIRKLFAIETRSLGNSSGGKRVKRIGQQVID